MTFMQDKGNNDYKSSLTGEHALGDVGQILLFFLFMLMWIGDSYYFRGTTFLNSYISPTIRIPLSTICLLASGYLSIIGLVIIFYEKREKPFVIRKSVFNVVRHPIYLGEILFYFGLLMISISITAGCVLIVIIFFLKHISKYEEMLLLKRFGEEYQIYMHEVPMLIPRLKSFWK